MTFGWNYPAGAENDSRAPWNQPDAPDCICDECDTEAEECEPDTACEECDNGTMREVDNEPDWDSMPGGADDY